MAVADVDQTLRFYTPGNERLGGAVPAEAFLETIAAALKALEQIAKDLSPGRPVVEWDIVDLKRSSFEITAAPRALRPEGHEIGRLATQRLILMTNAAITGGDPREFGSSEASAFVERMASAVSEDSIPEFRLTSGELTAVMNASSLQRVPRLAIDRSHGSIEGTMLGVSFAGSKPSFQVRHWLDRQMVTCYFDDDLESLVMSAMKKRVSISGMVTTRANGTVTNISEVRDIYVFPSDSELPRIDEMIGIWPDLTEGMPSEEWIRRGRDY